MFFRIASVKTDSSLVFIDFSKQLFRKYSKLWAQNDYIQAKIFMSEQVYKIYHLGIQTKCLAWYLVTHLLHRGQALYAFSVLSEICARWAGNHLAKWKKEKFWLCEKLLGKKKPFRLVLWWVLFHNFLLWVVLLVRVHLHRYQKAEDWVLCQFM